MKKLMLLLALVMSGFGFCATQITDLTVTPISSFGQVIVEFNVEGDAVPSEHPWRLTCTEVDSGKAYSTTQVATVTDGRHCLEWDMAADGIRLDNKAVTFKVEYQPTYLVIDLSGDTSATSYPVTVLAAPPEGGWTDEYKTTKLVLRAIESGSYKMNGSYDVTISKPFYMGVFEVTQKQYQLVTGSNPASYKGDARPVEQVSWNTIRGNSDTHNWPSVTTVDANSFMGKIRAKTGLTLDLPTEAQWEYACRAGTTSMYNNGGDTEADLKNLARYLNNGGGPSYNHAVVGSYAPNAWGLYDMHGNVWEACLDWRGNLSSGTDPVGASSGSVRLERGGCWNDSAPQCTSSFRGDPSPSTSHSGGGFRLACPAGGLIDLAEESERMTISTYIAATETVDGIEWSYEVVKNGEAKIYKEVGESAIPNTTTGAITIPSSLGGYPVTAIGDNAFKDCSALTSVTIPEGVTAIGLEVFNGCVNIAKMKSPLFKEGPTCGFYEACFTDKQAIDTERSIKDNVSRICESASMLYADTTSEYTTYAYGTNMYFEGGVTYYFSVKYDDRAFVKVDDCVVIAPHSSDVQAQEASIQFETSGWHWLELRGYNHGGPGATNNGTNPSFLWWTSVDATKRCFTTKDGNGIFRVIDVPTLSGIFGDMCVNLQDIELVGRLDKIPDNYFSGCSGLTSVTIPEGVTSIGASAFKGCSGLPSVTIPSSVTLIGSSAFEGCTGLTSVTFPNGLKLIESDAFYGCTNLTSVTIPEGVTIETPLVVFSDEMWSSLDVTEIGCDYGYRSPSIGRGRTTAMMFDVVGPTEFSFKWKVSSRSSADYLSWHLDGKKQSSISGTGGDWRTVTCSIPEGIHTIKWDYSTAGYSALGDNCGWVAFNGGAFGGCTSLETVTIPWSTTTPLFQLFPRAYTTLEDVILTGSSTTIVDYFFAGCTSLQSIDIPEGVTSIGVSAFEGCSSLTSITIPSSATSIGKNAFPNSVSITVNGTLKCSTWPANLSKSTLASVDIPDGTTEIPGSAFSGCTGLTSVTISEGVTSIGGSAFSGCTSLTSIVIPQSVEVINTSAFRGSALEEVIFEGIPPKFPRFSDAGVIYTGFAGAPLKIVKYLNHSSLWKELLQYYKHSAVNASDIAIPTNIPWIYIGRKVKVVSSFNGGEATSSSETCAEGDEITVTATPKEGYVFLGWSSDVAGISGVDSTLTFTMPEQEEVILVANFFPKALLEGWMDVRIEKKVDGETLLTAKQASEATEASISQKVADGELLTPAGAATQTEKVINQKVADGELITSDQLQVMAMEAPVIAVEDGVAKVGVSLKRATSLEGEWEQVEAEEAEITDEGAISVSVPAGEKAGFYKFVVPNEQ